MAEGDDLRADVERLQAELRSAYETGGVVYGMLKTRDQELAAANALLKRCREGFDWNQFDDPVQNQLGRDLDAHLASQPAAPKRGDTLSDGTWLRTPEEERAAPTRTTPDADLWHWQHRKEDRDCDCIMCLTAEARAARLDAMAKAPTRTESKVPAIDADIQRRQAEQRVLDAMHDVSAEELRFFAERHETEPLGRPCEAELARREAKRGQ